MYRNILILMFLFFSSAITAEEKPFLPPGGSAEYTSKKEWLKECQDVQRYRIGEDIVACVIKKSEESSYRLIMAYAKDFSNEELGKMLDGKLNPDLPLRSHSRFKCLRVTSGWMC